MAGAFAAALKHIAFKIALVLAINKLLGQANPSLHLRRSTPRRKGRQQKPKHRKPQHHLTTRIGAKGSLKGRTRRTSFPPRLETSTLMTPTMTCLKRRRIRNGLRSQMSLKFTLLMLRPQRVKQISDVRPTDLQASAQITKRVRVFQLRAHQLRQPNNLFMTHENGVVLVA